MTVTIPERRPRTRTVKPAKPITITVSSGPRNARTDPESGLRYYTWRGRELPSVTSIRRMAGVPHGLHQWTIGKVIDFALDHLKDFSSRLAGSDAAAQLKVIRHELRGASTAERDAAGKLGTAVHDAAASGKALSDVDPAVAPRLRQYLDWLEQSGAVILGSEFQVFNLTLGYAGSADLLVRMRDGSIWLVDLKTGKGIYGEHALQLMAYLMAEFVGADDVVDQELTDLLAQASGMAVLHLSDDAWEFHSLKADPETWAAFRGLLAFSTWMAGHGTVADITEASRSNKPPKAPEQVHVLTNSQLHQIVTAVADVAADAAAFEAQETALERDLRASLDAFQSMNQSDPDTLDEAPR